MTKDIQPVSARPFGLPIKKLFGFASKIVTGILRAAQEFVEKAIKPTNKDVARVIIQNDASFVSVQGSPSAAMVEDMSMALSYSSLGFLPVTAPSGSLPSLGTAIKSTVARATRRVKSAFSLKM